MKIDQMKEDQYNKIYKEFVKRKKLINLSREFGVKSEEVIEAIQWAHKNIYPKDISDTNGLIKDTLARCKILETELQEELTKTLSKTKTVTIRIVDSNGTDLLKQDVDISGKEHEVKITYLSR